MNKSKLEITKQYIERTYNDGDDFRYDVLSRKIQIRSIDDKTSGTSDPYQLAETVWRNLTDKDINTMACDCARETGINISDHEIRCVLGSDLVQDIHPLRDYINNLPEYQIEWGDVINKVADQVRMVDNGQCTMQEVWRLYFKKWFCAMVASWMYDDVVNHQVLVLVGKQGTGKTTWLEHLLPPELRSYVTKQASVRELSKDDRIRVAEFGLINMDEIDSCSPRELNVLKSVITTADVNERAAYGHTKERRIRCASFCASGNNREFLSDDTGNRRWLPFEVESIQNPFFTRLPYKQLYAQAWKLVQKGYNYWFDMNDIRNLEEHNEMFRQTRNEEELLGVYFEPVEPTEHQAVFMTASEIHAKLKMWGNITIPMPLNKFGELLRRRGYVRKKVHGGRCGYIVHQIDNQADRKHDDIMEIIKGGSGASIF